MKPKIAIVGGGAAALSFATNIDHTIYDISIFEKKNRLGSKLLVAGKGGFNLTHSEELKDLILRYSPTSFLKKALLFFDNKALRRYMKEIGIETYIGSSGRVFPVKGIKPIIVLKKIEKKIAAKQIPVYYNMNWKSISKVENILRLSFSFKGQSITKEFDFVIFAIGGASWKVTGSKGDWISQFSKHDINTIPFAPSNCALKVNWPSTILNNCSGKYIKNLSAKINHDSYLGEVVITDFGLEGTPIYALSKEARLTLNQNVNPVLKIDFKPNVTLGVLLNKINQKTTKNWSNRIEKNLNLTKTQMRLIKAYTTKEEFMSTQLVCKLIKNFPIQIESLASLDEAISTVGGIDLEEVNEFFELKKLPSVFAIGEMLNWDAPTGGYLIQGCFSMGQYLAKYFNQLTEKNL